MNFIVGIDEAGRGPLAGPVAVGLCVFNKKDKKKIVQLFPDARDSKQLSEKVREGIFKRMQSAKKNRILDFRVSLISSSVIDRVGIVVAIRQAITKVLSQVKVNPNKCQVLLDGGLTAPSEYIHQKTIIRGDTKELSIMLASISAKVTRDLVMIRYGKKFPKYGFEIHKGYGTFLHRQAIKKHGLSAIHRKLFCRNVLAK